MNRPTSKRARALRRAVRRARAPRTLREQVLTLRARGWRYKRIGREPLRRHGVPVVAIVTVPTPTGTECRRVVRRLGGWSV